MTVVRVRLTPRSQASVLDATSRTKTHNGMRMVSTGAARLCWRRSRGYLRRSSEGRGMASSGGTRDGGHVVCREDGGMATQQTRWRWATNGCAGDWRGYKSDLAGYSVCKEAGKEMNRRACVQLTHGREKGRWEEARQDKRTGGTPITLLPDQNCSREFGRQALFAMGDAPAACPATRGPIGSPDCRPDATTQPHPPQTPPSRLVPGKGTHLPGKEM